MDIFQQNAALSHLIHTKVMHNFPDISRSTGRVIDEMRLIVHWKTKKVKFNGQKQKNILYKTQQYPV